MNEHSPERGLDPHSNDAERLAVKALTEETVPSSLDQDAINDVFKALSDPAKRYILSYLVRSDGEVTIRDLVDYVTARTSISEPEERFRHKLTVELTHTHLPQLVEYGLIDYNMERQLIRSTELTSMVKPYLEVALAQQTLIAETEGDE